MRKIDVAAKRKKILQQWEKRYCSNDAITAAAMSKRGNRNLFHNCFAPVSHLQWSADDRVPSQMRDVLSGWENSSADIKNFSADAKALRWWDHLWADEIICKQTRGFVSKCDKSSLNVRICQQMRDSISTREFFNRCTNSLASVEILEQMWTCFIRAENSSPGATIPQQMREFCSRWDDSVLQQMIAFFSGCENS